MKTNLFISCAKGLEPHLAIEIKRLTEKDARVFDAGVSIEGGLAEAYLLLLWSRLASRVYWELGSAEIHNTDDLYEAALEVPWEEHLDARKSFAVQVSIRGEALPHSKFATLKLKDAIVDRFREREGQRPVVSRDQPDVAINAHVRGNRAVFNLDLAGSPLHERGYRLEAGAAPLKETLAAGLLQISGWPEMAKAGVPLLDLFTGSGTIPIEAALMAGDIAPGLLRNYFAVTGWNQHDGKLWRQTWREAELRRKQGAAQFAATQLHGLDLDARALVSAERNAERAGVPVSFSQGDARSVKNRYGASGLIVANPPYGERLGNSTELVSLYAELGANLRQEFPEWRLGLLVGDTGLGKTLGLRATKKSALWNGPIKADYLRFDRVVASTVKAPQAAGLMLAGGGGVALSQHAIAFKNRLEKNALQFRKWAERHQIECYRVYDADIPDYNVAVDIYKNSLVIQEYAAPEEIPEERTRSRLQDVLTVAPEVLGVDRARVYVKVRDRQKGSRQYQRSEGEAIEEIIHEGGHRFIVNFNNYLDTGIFLDHRLTRAWIEKEAKGKRFLNLFAYTGTATVYAVAGGAISSTTVDMSPTYLAWAERNLAENGLDSPAHTFVREDCRLWLKRARGPFDLVFCDPPTFSNSKRMNEAFQVQQDYLDLLAGIRRSLAPEGKVYFSNNFTKFRLDLAAVAALGFRVRELSRDSLPLDFARNPRIHRLWELMAAPVEHIVSGNPHADRKKEKPEKIFHETPGKPNFSGMRRSSIDNSRARLKPKK